MALPVGAAPVSVVYSLLPDAYGIGGEHGPQSPISRQWAGFAPLLSTGVAALTPGGLSAVAVCGGLGVLFTVLEGTRWRKWTPAATGLGIGMVVPATAIITMFLGSVVDVVW